MKKFSILNLLLSLILILTGCNSIEFSKPSSYKNLNPVADILLSVEVISPDNKKLTLLITNQSSTQLLYDGVYYIEQKRDDEWYSMDTEQAFNTLGYVIEPKGINKMNVTWESELSDGIYRIIKPIFIKEQTNYFSIEFCIGE